jgi:hypothetical protein
MVNVLGAMVWASVTFAPDSTIPARRWREPAGRAGLAHDETRKARLKAAGAHVVAMVEETNGGTRAVTTPAADRHTVRVTSSGPTAPPAATARLTSPG